MSPCTIIGDTVVLSEPIHEPEEFDELEFKICADPAFRQDLVRLYLQFSFFEKKYFDLKCQTYLAKITIFGLLQKKLQNFF